MSSRQLTNCMYLYVFRFSKNCKIPDPVLSTFWPYQRRVFPEKHLQLFKDFTRKHYKEVGKLEFELNLTLSKKKFYSAADDLEKNLGFVCFIVVSFKIIFDIYITATVHLSLSQP